MQIMISNGGPHPPERWADVSTNEIMGLIQIEPTAAPEFAIQKREFEMKVLRLLIDAHARAQQAEKDAIRANGDQHLFSQLNPLPNAQAATVDVVNAAQGTAFSDHFNKPETQAVVTNIIGQHMADSMHLERRWHADRNQHTSPTCREFRKKYGG